MATLSQRAHKLVRRLSTLKEKVVSVEVIVEAEVVLSEEIGEQGEKVELPSELRSEPKAIK